MVRIGLSLMAIAATMAIIAFCITYFFEPHTSGGDAAGNGMARGLFFFYIVLPVSFLLALGIWGVLIWVLKVNLSYYTGVVLAVTLIPYTFMQITSGLKENKAMKRQQTQVQEYSIKTQEFFTQLANSDLSASVEDSDLEIEKIRHNLSETKFILNLGVRYFANAYGLAHGIPEHELSDVKQGLDLYVSPLLKSVFFKNADGMKWADSKIKIIELTPEQKNLKIPYLKLVKVVSLQDVGLMSYGLIVRFENAPNSSTPYFINAGLQMDTCPEGFYFGYSHFYCMVDAFVGNEDMSSYLGFIDFNELNAIVEYSNRPKE